MRASSNYMTSRNTKTLHERKTQIARAIEKIVVNAGVGKAGQQAQFEEKTLPQITKDIAFLAGQKPQVRRAKKAIAGFRLREGQVVGLRVTLRGAKMVDFFERLVTIVLPRTHDFRGIANTSIDEGGALHVGFREQFVFPEINPEESTFSFSLGINIVPKTKKKDREKSAAMYQALGVQFKK